MKIDPSQVYNMPLVAGPLFEINHRPRYVYKHVENLILQYRTDSAAIREILPESYQVGKEPVVTLAFSHNDGVEFLSGRGYRIATVMVSARFDGKQDHEEGNYIVVMFEDDSLPIIGGREHLGLPKIFADISPIKTLPGTGNCAAMFPFGDIFFMLSTCLHLKSKTRSYECSQPDKDAPILMLQIHPIAGRPCGCQLPDHLVHGYAC